MAPTPDRSTLLKLTEASPIPMLVSRASDGEVLYANDSIALLMGSNVRSVVGMHTTDFYADADNRRALIDTLREKGRVDQYEVRLRALDGRTFWATTTLVLSEADGEPVIVGGIYDIDERRKAEEALRESEALFRQLTENINAVFWMRELATGDVLYCSPAFERLYGRPPEEVNNTADAILDAVHPDDKPMVVGMVQAAMEERAIPPETEFRIVRPDGQVRWVRTRIFPVRDGEGKIYRVCGVTEDFTDRKSAEESLERERSFVSTILDTAGALVVVLDADANVLRWNRACERLSGYTFEEVKGLQFWDKVLEAGEVPDIRAVYDNLTDGHFPVESENHWRTKAGERRLISWSSSVLRDAGGAVTYVIGTGIDITERQRALDALEAANEELRTAQSQLVQTEKMAALGNLVAGIAHEINTPVGAINSMHDTLTRGARKVRESVEGAFGEGDATGDAIKQALTVVEDANRVVATAAERVTEIVRSLRSFARLDEAEMKRANIHEGIDTTLTLVHHNLKNRVEVVKDYGDVPEIVCWPSRLNQVFLNILVNAGQAIREKGEIRIRTLVKDGKVHVSFTDNGAGIPEENLKRIFDPGFTTKGVGVGTGLGLSICYQIVNDHKGEILVDSEAGKGTTFTVVLPTDLKEVPKGGEA